TSWWSRVKTRKVTVTRAGLTFESQKQFQIRKPRSEHPPMSRPIQEAPLRSTIIVALLAVSAPPPPGKSNPLRQGASTEVPAAANAAYHSLLTGQPFAIRSAVTGVRFHLPGVISSAAGGLSETPVPLHKIENGVRFVQYTGELSGKFTD